MIKDIFKKINGYIDIAQSAFLEDLGTKEKFFNGFKNAVDGAGEKNTLDQTHITSLLDEMKAEIQSLRVAIFLLKSLKASMTSSGLCKPFSDILPVFGFLFSMSSQIPLNMEEMVQLYGYFISYKANYYKRNPKALKKIAETNKRRYEEILFVTRMEPYFDDEGHVLPNEEVTILKDSLIAFSSYYFSNTTLTEEKENFYSFMEVINLSILNQLKVCNQQKKVNCNELPAKTSMASSIKNQGQNILWRELAIYYLDGEIIAPCDDLNHFRDLLLALGLSTAEVERIYRKMEKFIIQENEAKTAKYPFSKEEKDLLERGRKNSYKENIKAILTDIDVALALFNEDPSCLSDIEPLMKDSLKMLSYALPIENQDISKKSFV